MMERLCNPCPMNKILACLRIMRPLNAVIAFAGIFVAGLIAGAVPARFPALALAALAGALVGAAGNILNDIRDVEVDRINKPRRVLPSALLTMREAWIWGGVCAAGGIAAGYGVSPLLGTVASISALLVGLYDVLLKNLPVIGNAVVSLLVGTAFVFGAASAGNAAAGIVPGIFGFLYTFGREVVKDVEDMEGDRAAGAATLPIAFGIPAARRLATGAFLLLVLGSFVPYVAGEYNLLYLAAVVPGVDALAAYVIVRLWKDDSRENFRRMSALLKIGMPLGIAALYLGTVTIG